MGQPEAADDIAKVVVFFHCNGMAVGIRQSNRRRIDGL